MRQFWGIILQIRTFSLKERFQKVFIHLLKILSTKHCIWSTFWQFLRVFKVLHFIFWWFHHESYTPISLTLNHIIGSKTCYQCWFWLNDVKEWVHWHQECWDLHPFLWLKTLKILHFHQISSRLKVISKFIHSHLFH